jgi:hypothetical protein
MKKIKWLSPNGFTHQSFGIVRKRTLKCRAVLAGRLLKIVTLICLNNEATLIKHISVIQAQLKNQLNLI